MTQTQVTGDIGIMRHRKDATCTHDFRAIDDEGAIVQGTVLEEDIFNQARIDIGVNHIARALIVSQRNSLLHHNECARPGFGHVHAGIDHW